MKCLRDGRAPEPHGSARVGATWLRPATSAESRLLLAGILPHQRWRCASTCELTKVLLRAVRPEPSDVSVDPVSEPEIALSRTQAVVLGGSEREELRVALQVAVPARLGGRAAESTDLSGGVETGAHRGAGREDPFMA